MLDTDGDGVVEEGERFSTELVTLFTHMNRYSSPLSHLPNIAPSAELVTLFTHMNRYTSSLSCSLPTPS